MRDHEIVEQIEKAIESAEPAQRERVLAWMRAKYAPPQPAADPQPAPPSPSVQRLLDLFDTLEKAGACPRVMPPEFVPDRDRIRFLEPFVSPETPPNLMPMTFCGEAPPHEGCR